MGSVQRPPEAAPSTNSAHRPPLHRCERSSPVKNRMREICTSGTVRGGGGNILTYSEVPTKARTARCAGCVSSWDLNQTCELHFRCRRGLLFRLGQQGLAGPVRGAPHRRQAHHPSHPQMAEGG